MLLKYKMMSQMTIIQRLLRVQNDSKPFLLAAFFARVYLISFSIGPTDSRTQSNNMQNSVRTCDEEQHL